jgi:predicted ArsR family transcriptional regulator
MPLLQATQLPPPAPAPQVARQAEVPTRDRVLELVRDRTWTAAELGEVLNVDRKTAEYHLHALRRRGLVAERWLHGQRRFTLAAGAPRAFAEATPARTRYRVALEVEQRGLVPLDELAASVGVSRSLAAYHVRRLAQEDIVRVRRLGARVLVQAKGLAVQARDEEPAA